ncbi:MAG: hypothetical protein QOI12_468 [Alphaproteobacteria bacterium]|jgi:hypothetical protein|nr:hypothetical protein [Alphaproteobacteria bacterium]
MSAGDIVCQSLTTHTLVWRRKSSGMSAILWLLCLPTDHLWIAQNAYAGTGTEKPDTVVRLS